MLLIPIGDEPNLHTRTPWVNWSLIAANILVFLTAVFTTDGDAGFDLWVREWGFTPIAPRLTTYFTSMFMHAGWLHLGGNMLFLYIFGDNVEGRLGHLGYLLAYLGAGLGAVLLYQAFDPNSTLPYLGASGAVYGVEGFYFLAFPRHRVRVFIWLFVLVWVYRVNARIVLGLYFLFDLWNLFRERTLPGGEMQGGVAYAAHVGGFFFGLALAFAVHRLLPASQREPEPPRARRAVGSRILLASAEAHERRGRTRQALAAYEAVFYEFPGTSAAATAALRAGLLRAGRLNDPEGARPLLQYALRNVPDTYQRDLALEALQRL